ncbi:hypothetical protein GUJ93_ZPchr0003g17700 [Zizania palustris]|uniref:Uncharacterized protein n=1 Tax=Zizania palustris TaxID=103762 RepID=A0A8J5SVL1_ZIZPA|nr:hypothetical protein GUJ93_ZPchr0003g17700 [Zizania palustris]
MPLPAPSSLPSGASSASRVRAAPLDPLRRVPAFSPVAAASWKRQMSWSCRRLSRAKPRHPVVLLVPPILLLLIIDT